MRNITEYVKHIIIINVIFFLGSQLVPQAYDLFSMYYFENEKFKFWQPITSMFMHARFPNIMHILFNMLAVFMFGSALEQVWGGKKFLFFYISCGLGAALLHTGVNYYEFHSSYQILIDGGLTPENISYLLNNGSVNANVVGDPIIVQNAVNQISGAYHIPVVGASGAIYGILVAFAFLYPNVELMMMFIPIPIKAKYFVPGILLIDLFLGLNGNSIFGGSSGVAHFAHLGGAITGFLIMKYWQKNQFNSHRWN